MHREYYPRPLMFTFDVCSVLSPFLRASWPWIGGFLSTMDKIVDRVADAVCAVCRVTPMALKGPTLIRVVVDARKLFTFFCRNFYDCSVNEIAQYLGRSENTVWHDYRRCAWLLSHGDYITELFRQIANRLGLPSDKINNEIKRKNDKA